MKTFRVYYQRRTSITCYMEVDANSAHDAANIAQEKIVDGDDELHDVEESFRGETVELGRVEELTEDWSAEEEP